MTGVQATGRKHKQERGRLDCTGRTAYACIEKDLEGLVEELRRKTKDRGVERVENDRTIIDQKTQPDLP